MVDGTIFTQQQRRVKVICTTRKTTAEHENNTGRKRYPILRLIWKQKENQ